MLLTLISTLDAAETNVCTVAANPSGFDHTGLSRRDARRRENWSLIVERLSQYHTKSRNAPNNHALARYTELAPGRFKGFWRDWPWHLLGSVHKDR